MNPFRIGSALQTTVSLALPRVYGPEKIDNVPTSLAAFAKQVFYGVEEYTQVKPVHIETAKRRQWIE